MEDPHDRALRSAGAGPSRFDPALSVVIPVYNREGSIGRTIESILRSASGAAPGEIELIVVDDGSHDGSAAAAEAAAEAFAGAVPVTVLRQANGGPGAARNAGVARARGGHVAFVDSDDVWFDWTLPACLKAIAAHPDAALFFLKPCVFSQSRPLAPRRGEGARLDRCDGFITATQRYADRSFGTNNVIVRRDVFAGLDGFAPEFRCLEDTDLFLRADSMGPCIVFDGDDLIGRRRGDDDSLTDNWAHVIDGLDRMKRRERAGVYPGGAFGDPRRRSFVAGTAVRATRLCFANGRSGRAYRVYAQNFLDILRGGRALWALRLPLTPAMALVRSTGARPRARRTAGG